MLQFHKISRNFTSSSSYLQYLTEFHEISHWEMWGQEVKRFDQDLEPSSHTGETTLFFNKDSVSMDACTASSMIWVHMYANPIASPLMVYWGQSTSQEPHCDLMVCKHRWHGSIPTSRWEPILWQCCSDGRRPLLFKGQETLWDSPVELRHYMDIALNLAFVRWPTWDLFTAALAGLQQLGENQLPAYVPNWHWTLEVQIGNTFSPDETIALVGNSSWWPMWYCFPGPSLPFCLPGGLL